MSDTSAAGILALTGVFIGLTTISVALRFLVRCKTKVAFMADDWIILFALFPFYGAAVCIFLLVHIKSLGYSTFQFPESYFLDIQEESAKLRFALDVTTIACLACTKISALLFYKRIFSVPGPGVRIFSSCIIATIVVVACWLITFEFLAGFQCHDHFSAQWEHYPLGYEKYCTISWNFLYSLCISDFLLDVIVVALPIPTILRLHTTTAKKLSILCVFVLAATALGASLARMVVFIKIYIIGYYTYSHIDSQHVATRFAFYYILECGCAIVAINLPSLWLIISLINLENVIKSARSVISLVSGTSTNKTESWTDRGTQHSSRTMEEVHTGTMSADVAIGRDVHAANWPEAAKNEIIRHDSVQISSHTRNSDEGDL